MKIVALAAVVLLGCVAAAHAVTENINWSNPADASVTGINVQTAASPAGPFVNVNPTPLSPTTTQFSRTVPLSVQDCIQVVWVNPLGPSAPLGPTCGTPNPAQKGTGLTIIYQP